MCLCVFDTFKFLLEKLIRNILNQNVVNYKIKANNVNLYNQYKNRIFLKL